jgi:outer membrane protein OmpA-like peptidoglycan-associated protein
MKTLLFTTGFSWAFLAAIGQTNSNQCFTIPNVYFDFNKATWLPESKRTLDTLITHLKSYDIKNTLAVFSFADSLEHEPLALSEARSKKVRSYLISAGIESARISTKSFGARFPIAPNKKNGKDHPTGRQLNRRTEFHIYSLSK